MHFVVHCKPIIKIFIFVSKKKSPGGDVIIAEFYETISKPDLTTLNSEHDCLKLNYTLPATYYDK